MAKTSTLSKAAEVSFSISSSCGSASLLESSGLSPCTHSTSRQPPAHPSKICGLPSIGYQDSLPKKAYESPADKTHPATENPSRQRNIMQHVKAAIPLHHQSSSHSSGPTSQQRTPRTRPHFRADIDTHVRKNEPWYPNVQVQAKTSVRRLQQNRKARFLTSRQICSLNASCKDAWIFARDF